MRGVGAGTRIFEVIDRTPIIHPEAGLTLSLDRRGPIRFEKIGFEYPSRKGVEILKDFDLQLNVGESVAIVYVSFVP
jgi:putative ABC transport system ATP-binding protein